MNKKAIGIFAALLCISTASQAQYVEDAMRFSQTENGATSRFKSMGNIGTALGGDLSSITGNPAGLGFFNTSDAGITLNYLNDKNTSNYYGTSTSAGTDKLSLSQAGVVFNMPVRSRSARPSGWLNFNVGIGYSRTNDFNSAFNFNGTNTNSSFTNRLSEAAVNDPVFDEWGFQSFLLDERADNSLYPAASESLTNDQMNSDTRTGSQRTTNFSFGANYNNKFYIGASIGIASFNYESRRRFDELGDMKSAGEFEPGSAFLDPENADLLGAPYELSFSSLQKTNGTGYNGTLGMIFRPEGMFQIGVSATTPTWYTVTDDYSMFFDSWIDPIAIGGIAGETVEYHSEEELYYDEYDLRTPYRLNAGVSAIFEQGLISAEVEYVDYSSMKISARNQAADLESADIISNDFKGAANFRLGGEYRLAPEFLLRAGYNYRGNPYQNISSNRQTVSAGLGYRISNMYIDLAYLNERYDMEYTPYQSIDFPADPASVKNMRNNVSLTVGFKF